MPVFTLLRRCGGFLLLTGLLLQTNQLRSQQAPATVPAQAGPKGSSSAQKTTPPETDASTVKPTDADTGAAPSGGIGSDNNETAGGNTLFTRSTAGVTLAAANGASPTSRLFVDFDLTAPLLGTSKPPGEFLSAGCQSTAQQRTPQCKNEIKQKKRLWQSWDPLTSRLWVFWNPRLTSVSQSNVAIGSAASATSSIFQNAGNTDLTKLVQTFEMEQGLEVPILRRGPAMPNNFGMPATGSEGSRLALFLFGSYGVGVPVSASQNVTSIYVGNPTLDALYGAPANTQYIAVEEKSKDRFYRSFYLGFHLKTFGYKFEKCPKGWTATNGEPTADGGTITSSDATQKNSPGTSEETPICPQVENQFPGTYEVAWGQDDSINGQALTGGVVRIKGFYPLPFLPTVHLFGGVYLSLKHKNFVNSSQFVLAQGNVNATSPGVFQAGVNPPDRDQYQFGIGIDLLELYKSRKKSATSDSSAAAATPKNKVASGPS